MLGPTFNQILWVGLGGFIGSAGRFALTGAVHRWLPASTFPYGTLAVNILGCLAVGFLGGLLDLKQIMGPSQRLFLMVGVLGGFTTVAAFAYDTVGLFHGSEYLRASLNVLANIGLGLAAAWLGHLAAQTV